MELPEVALELEVFVWGLTYTKKGQCSGNTDHLVIGTRLGLTLKAQAFRV